MSETLQVLLRTLVTCACPVGLLFVMSSFKCRQKTVWAVFAGIVLFSTAVCSALFFTVGLERMRQVYFLILLSPSLLFLLFATTDRPSQIFFNFFTAVNAFYLTSILSHFALGAKDEPIWADALIRLGIFAIILFLFDRYLRDAYQFIAANMKRGWRVMAVLPFLFFGLVMFLGLYPHTRTDNLVGVVFLYGILCVVYYVIYWVFHNTYHLLKTMGENDTLKSQVRAFQNQAELLKSSEKKLGTLRHDMRHYFSNIAALLQNGETEEVLHFLGKFDEVAEGTKLAHYCENATLNIILSFYIEKAEREGIKVNANLDIPETLPVDTIALSTVFANAIENAITACGKIPEGQERRIELTCFSSPRFVLEVANTCEENVVFGPDGLPVSDQPGHGIGTRSIAAFARENGAVCDYRAGDGMFRLRILIQ